MTTTTKSSAPYLTVLGFDFGLKKIGVAAGQSITQTASPVEIVRVENGELPEAHLQKLLQTWRPNALIVGIPLNMDDSTSFISDSAEAFAKLLEARSHLPVHRVDERLTTRHAKYELQEIADRLGKKNKAKRVDAFAACLIVETWLRHGAS